MTIRALPAHVAGDLERALAEPANGGAARRLATFVQTALACEVLAILVYGSRSRGEATAASDWDVVALVRGTSEVGIFGVTAGVDLDLHAVDVERATSGPADAIAHLGDARVVYDVDERGARLVARAKAAASATPRRSVPSSEIDQFACWARRMISRIRQDSSVDPVRAALRLAWLETTAYGAWFRLVGEPEPAIAVGAERIARTAPEAHALLLKGFGSASLDARVEAIEPFVAAVVARARTLRPLEVHAHDFHPVIRLPGDYEVYDFTRGYDPSRALTSAYGIGRYDEGRVGMYETELFGGVRDVHMGIDIGAPVGEPVHAFHDGEVHMFGYNGAPGDYGTRS